MQIKVKYRQEFSMGIYTLVRIIELKPDNLIFKNKVKQNVVSTLDRSVEDYMLYVKMVLDYTKKELMKRVKPVINEQNRLPLSLTEEIIDYEIDLDIKL